MRWLVARAGAAGGMPVALAAGAANGGPAQPYRPASHPGAGAVRRRQPVVDGRVALDRQSGRRPARGIADAVVGRGAGDAAGGDDDRAADGARPASRSAAPRMAASRPASRWRCPSSSRSRGITASSIPACRSRWRCSSPPPGCAGPPTAWRRALGFGAAALVGLDRAYLRLGRAADPDRRGRTGARSARTGARAALRLLAARCCRSSRCSPGAASAADRRSRSAATCPPKDSPSRPSSRALAAVRPRHDRRDRPAGARRNCACASARGSNRDWLAGAGPADARHARDADHRVGQLGRGPASRAGCGHDRARRDRPGARSPLRPVADRCRHQRCSSCARIASPRSMAAAQPASPRGWRCSTCAPRGGRVGFMTPRRHATRPGALDVDRKLGSYAVARRDAFANTCSGSPAPT